MSYSDCTSAISTRKARRTCSKRYRRDSKCPSTDSDSTSTANDPLCCCQMLVKQICSMKGRLDDETAIDLVYTNLKHYRKKRRHARTAVMLAVITATFAISYGPYQILDLLRYKRWLNDRNYNEKYSGGRFNLDYLFYHLYFLNSMMNPIIYCFMNASFRAKILKIFCCFPRKSQ
ncbi:hypothetical protein Ciccas_008540 [Cichlidogyrus casuarinus]|uniref:G-protein coupled receptors family 1 profile domain-containing protein n=1 Tax=Cichlidogyrus casuarinus TaxID=1844966 RepID=A0ABD2Q0Y8_9PLAT